MARICDPVGVGRTVPPIFLQTFDAYGIGLSNLFVFF